MALRVVAGSVGGRRLVAPKGDARPSTDRLKEALFAALGRDRIVDTTVLDLYAGSGALAIEALSRGATQAVLVDRDGAAEQAIRANLRTTEFEEAARFQRSTVSSFLARPVAEAPFDLVFLDPPYDMPSDEVTRVLAALAVAGVVAAAGTIAIERPKAGVPIEIPEGWQIQKERAYGDTLLVVAIA
jgi:16S rRNA (guanine966-N2)-methyltransferase